MKKRVWADGTVQSSCDQALPDRRADIVGFRLKVSPGVRDFSNMSLTLDDYAFFAK
jgi:hypothetical protein